MDMDLFTKREGFIDKTRSCCYDKYRKGLSPVVRRLVRDLKGSRLTCRLGGCYFFMHMMHRVITPMITEQKEKSPS